MANSKGAYAGHGKYNKKMCADVVSYYQNGESDAEVSVKLDVSKQTFYQWIKTKPDFSDAVDRGKTLSESWWQKLGRAGASGKVKINARVYIANMKNRFKWIETVIVDREGVKGEDVLEVLQPLLDKYDKKY